MTSRMMAAGTSFGGRTTSETAMPTPDKISNATTTE